MKTQFAISVITSILILGSIGIFPIFQEASASTVKTCDDEVISTGIFKNIVVPEGKSCTITGDTIIEKNLTADGANDVTVNGAPLVIIGGDVKIENSFGTILINNSEIDGKVKLLENSDNDISITSNNIAKNVELKMNSATDGQQPGFFDIKIVIYKNTIGGDVKLENNITQDDIFLFENIIGGNVIFRENQVEQNDIIILRNSIDGNLKLETNFASGEIDVWLSNISGNVNLKSNTFGQLISINDNVVQGGLTVKNHEAGDTTDISFNDNTIGHDLKIIKNTQSSISLSDSIVNGDIKIEKNNSESIRMFLNEANGKIIVKKNIVEPFRGGSQGILFFNNMSSEKIIISDNVVESDLSCRDNVPDPTGKNNIVGGSKLEQCSSL